MEKGEAPAETGKKFFFFQPEKAVKNMPVYTSARFPYGICGKKAVECLRNCGKNYASLMFFKISSTVDFSAMFVSSFFSIS